MEPETPVMVTVTVPVAAELEAVSVSGLLLVAGFVPKEALTPEGNPDADRVTLLLKPFDGFIVMVLVPCDPRVTLTLPGDAERVKLGEEAGLTVSEIVVVCWMEPETPAMVTVTVPVAAVLLAVRLRTLLLVAGLVPKVALTPEGNPEADSVTLPVNPPDGFIVIVSVPLAPPWVMVTPGEERDRVKLGDGGATRALIKPEPLGLPHPVARS